MEARYVRYAFAAVENLVAAGDVPAGVRREREGGGGRRSDRVGRCSTPGEERFTSGEFFPPLRFGRYGVTGAWRRAAC